MNSRSIALMACLTLAATFSAHVKASDGADTKAKDVVTTFWAMPKEPGTVTLLALGEAKPITVAAGAETVFGGICHECNMPLRFKSATAAKSCDTCGCAVSVAECLAWGHLKPNSWEGMLKALPPGTALRAIYNTKDKPESGLKSLIVDRRVVLLPVEGMGDRTREELLLLVKPFGGVRAEMTGSGKQLSITLKDDWTAAREIRLEKALAASGAKVAFPIAETVKP